MSPDALNDILGYVSTAAFASLALVSLWHWNRGRGRPSLWAALCFGALALVVLGRLVLPEDPTGDLQVVLQHLLVVVLLAFPYCLYRFAAAFHPVPHSVEWVVGTAALILLAWTVALPDFPASGEPRSAAFEAYIVAFLVYWTVLSVIVAATLWRAGRGQPSVARHRMRFLSVAALLITVAVLIQGGNPEGSTTRELASSVLTIVSAFAFLLGLAPPAVVRVVWRREEGERWRETIPDLVKLSTPEQIIADVLPSMARLVGARAAYFLDHGGRVLGSHGAPPVLPDAIDESDPAVLRIAVPGGVLVARASPYAPFFGTEEIELLRTLGNLVSLALDRSRLFVAERDARMELERADELKSTFIALAAHELRTPVTSVHGLVATIDGLGEELGDDDRAELEEALRTQTERMRRLVEQLLDLSRLEADRVPIQPVSVPVRAQVEDLVAASAGSRADEIEVRIDDELEAVVDPSVLEHVVSNLVTNALRHGDSPVVVTATNNDGHLRVAVEDNGPGVPEEFVQDLFERFSRSDEARARGLGSGLGLAIARSYAQAHGGDLVYVPLRPNGSRFEVVVPVGNGRSGQRSDDEASARHG
ncbi:MAG TPA: ATP-binding protein [Gaiellaceae bacterium]|nr:ATP-binding protein [Gaiellaceae bacterium]